MNKLTAVLASFVIVCFLVGGVSSMQTFATSPGGVHNLGAPNVTYFVARWGLCTDCNHPHWYHHTTPDNGYGFNYYQAGSFAMYQQIESNGSVYNVLSNFNGQKGLKLGFIDYNVGTPGTINSINITGSGTYYVKLWFDSAGNGSYGGWTSEGLRTSMGGDTIGIVQVSNPSYISGSTKILVTFIDGVACTKNCMYTYKQIQEGKLKGVSSDTEMAFNLQQVSTSTGTIWFLINSVTFNS